MNYSEALKMLRIYNGLPVEEVAKRLKMSSNTIRAKENKSNQVIEKDLTRFSELYGVPVETLKRLAEELDEEYTGEKVEVNKYRVLDRAELRKRLEECAYLLDCKVQDILLKADVSINFGSKKYAESKTRLSTFEKLANVVGVPVKDFINPNKSTYDLAREYDIQNLIQKFEYDYPEKDEEIDRYVIDMYRAKLQDPHDDKPYRISQLVDIFKAYMNAYDVKAVDIKDIFELLEDASEKVEL